MGMRRLMLLVDRLRVCNLVVLGRLVQRSTEHGAAVHDGEKISGPIPDPPGVTLKRVGCKPSIPLCLYLEMSREAWSFGKASHVHMASFGSACGVGHSARFTKGMRSSLMESCVPISTSVNRPNSSAITPFSHRCQSSHGKKLT